MPSVAGLPIHIPISNLVNFPLRNDGTVVLSDYQKNVTTNHYWFTFTTMATLYDGTHPVSGNRRFGIVPHPNGGWQFYISGVDRAWGWYTALGNFLLDDFGFQEADELWGTIQSNIVNYISNHQGEASFFIPTHNSSRINWSGNIIPFLNGNISLYDLKSLLHCN